MAIDRLLRANRLVLVVPTVDGLDGKVKYVTPTGTLVPFEAPTVALLEGWRAITGTAPAASAHGGNPSGAILDDMDLGLAASDTDTELTIISLGNEVSPTFKNIDATLNGLRDKNKADTGVYNLFTQLFVGSDVRYALIDRIGSAPTDAYTVGDVVSAFEIRTDIPADQKADRGNLKLQQQPVTTGQVLSNFTIAA